MSHRRSRHINPKSCGANLAFDTRFLSLNDNDLVSSFQDRSSGVVWTASGSARPTYKSRISGGSAMIQSSSGNELTGDSATYLSTSANITIVTINSSNNSGEPQVLGSLKASGGNEWLFYSQGSLSYWTFRGSSFGRVYTRLGANIIGIESFSNSRAIINGSIVSSSAISHGGSGNTNALCDAGSQNTSWRGFIGQLIVFNFFMSDSLLKRIHHSSAFSFKIKCS